MAFSSDQVKAIKEKFSGKKVKRVKGMNSSCNYIMIDKSRLIVIGLILSPFIYVFVKGIIILNSIVK